MDKRFKWRIQLAAILTAIGSLYYLIFLFYLSGGAPIERIHSKITDGWPDILADNVPLISPAFLVFGLLLWYSYYLKNLPKPQAEPEYKFEFNKVNASEQAGKKIKIQEAEKE
ncbi:hypothetical protein [Mucilaginibacter paludis]|uniref:Uncharacterized protein n=1 Tax=Mucilaginibacter paludis DSM 18603 TaxID=714943 RepID=H1YCR6_9SPHI|nr:hypothetical protein [Mucilaginibacter paludis]EHQ24253.1 hypothetical protein Mucpa_0049 [Mucilaginibacter paludis DSM 18603]